MEEIWKPVRGFEEYAEVSNLGQIHRFERVIYSGRGHKAKRIQEESWTYGSENNKGYLTAHIGGISKGVHVWVFMTFNDCDVPKGYDVNHLDENKHNNCVWNLNLLNHDDNMRYGTGIERCHAALTNHPNMSKAVQALNPTTMEVVMEFPSTREAKRQGFDSGAVSACCLGKRKSHKGFIWRFRLPQ